MRFLLDTNICIYLIKKQPASVLQRFQQYTVGDIGISSITVAELQYGVQKSHKTAQNQRALVQFLMPLVIADFNAPAAVAYGEIRALLAAKGTPIGSLDTLIAAHARSLEVTLVTNNIREFTRVPNLNVVNWVA